MPERQSSPGEVARPHTARANGNGHAPDASVVRPDDEATSGVDHAADQVADQVAAEPEAVDPAPAEPGESAPTAAGPVADGAALTEAASTEPDPETTPASGAVATNGAAASPRPRPRPAPAVDPAGDDTPTVATSSSRSGTAQPVAPEPDAAEDGPTVAMRAGGPAADDGRSAWFRPFDAEATQVIPRGPAPADGGEAATAVAAGAVPTGGAATNGEAPTERIRMPAAPVPPPPDDSGPTAPVDAGSERPRRTKRRLLLVAGVVAVLAVLYVGDLLFSSGSVPRGTTVAGVGVGGLGLADAEQKLRSQLEPRTTQPVSVAAGEATSTIDPRAAGLTVDWTATLDRAGAQPLNPIVRITSFFTSREVGVATSSDPVALDTALAQLGPIVDKAPAEGAVRFDGTTPVAVNPVPGQRLDVPGAAAVLQRTWLAGGTIALPLTELPPVTTPEHVATAIEKVAKPAVSAPVTVLGENAAKGTLAPEVIAQALTFRADPATGLVPELNQTTISDALKPQLAASEKPGRDAALDFSSGTPVVVPSQDGRGIDYPATLKDLLPVLTGTGPRQITAVYADQPAKLTTEKLNALGITGVIGEFSTGGFAADSGKNIKRAAEQLNGIIVQPGETFSLNATTNPRDAAHGYVEAGIIEDGHAARGIGGGVSQVATTLYNASYFAGMTNVAHKEHSFYISRYPPGREATVFDNIIDLKFRNDNPTGVMIQTAWTPSSLTVRIYGTKRYEVTSTPGPRTNPTNPNTITIPPGQPCSPSQGAPGFTVTDTRTLKEISTGQVRNETRTVRYNPSPIVVCGH